MKKEFLNLEVLKKSRKKAKPGDIFVYKPKDHEYYFGRTVSTEAHIGSFHEGVLIYLYNSHSKDVQEISQLSKEQLLLPPLVTNYLPWTRGYFETIANKELTENDIFHPHCFYDNLMKRYVNEYEQELDKAYDPVGTHGLASYVGIDVKISQALEIPLPKQHPYSQLLAKRAAKKSSA